MKPNEFESLSILAEECGEVTQAATTLLKECGDITQAIGKIFRHGFDSRWNNGLNNREYLELEIADILGIVEVLFQFDIINRDVVDNKIKKKYGEGLINRYLHTFKVSPVDKYIFIVKYYLNDGGDCFSGTIPVQHWNNDIEDLRASLEKYYDHKYLERVTIREIVPLDEWIKNNTLDLEKWFSEKVR